MRSKIEARAKLRNLFLREWRRPHLEYKVPKPTPPGSRWQRLPTGHDLLSPLSYRDRHILNRAKNFVAVAAQLTSARGPGYASRTLTPTPISTSRTTA